MTTLKEPYRILLCLLLTMLYSSFNVAFFPSVSGIWLSGATTGAMIFWIVEYWKEQKGSDGE